MGDATELLRSSGVAFSREPRHTVLRHDVVREKARRRDTRAGSQTPHDPRPLSARGRCGQRDDRPPSGCPRRPQNEVELPADAGDLAAATLSAFTWPRRSTSSAELTAMKSPSVASTWGSCTTSDGSMLMTRLS